MVRIARGPGVLRPGDRVRFDGIVRTVVGVSGTVVLLADEQAETMAIRLAQLQAKHDFEVVGQGGGVGRGRPRREGQQGQTPAATV
jgi:hypothetical protein